jgi:hypothetical protein
MGRLETLKQRKIWLQFKYCVSSVAFPKGVEDRNGRKNLFNETAEG